MISVGIVGSGGYVAGELIRCLVNHPEVEIKFSQSHSQSGKNVGEVHQDLALNCDLAFSDVIDTEVDLVFLCLGHGNSRTFLEKTSFSDTTKIIDLSNDFRLSETAKIGQEEFVYGLIALNKKEIPSAKYVANPGCFATAIQLGLLPLAAKNILSTDIHVNAITGATGAGQGLSATTHFSWRNNNISVYKAFSHQHLDEIRESIVQEQSTFDNEINFLPVRGDFTRGIFATMYTKSDLSETELLAIYQDYYKSDPFMFITNKPIHLKQVVNTNNCFIQVQKMGGKVLITSVIDNLIKGAAGQAIQNMNLMFGLSETAGLNFKATYF